MLAKKNIPGPSHYKNMDPYKPKIFGFYDSTNDKVTDIETTIFVKKDIPAPSKYESRGKGMSEILKEKAKAYLYHAAPDFTRTSGVKKTKDPGPTTYKVTEALDKSAKTRRNYHHVIPKNKNVNFMSKSSLRMTLTFLLLPRPIAYLKEKGARCWFLQNRRTRQEACTAHDKPQDAQTLIQEHSFISEFTSKPSKNANQ